jgi:hypothetical protein
MITNEMNRLATLPEGAVLQRIAFTDKPLAGQEVLLSFLPPINQYAVILGNDAASIEGQKEVLTLLVIPISPSATDVQSQGSPNESLGQVQHWVEASEGSNATAAQWMTFQGTQICWTPHRCAILGAPERLESLRLAVVEVYYYESELRRIERALGESWPAMETDIPLAYEFHENSLGKQKSLQQRFQQVAMLRARLARLGPFVYSPHLHPPTLASQIAERFRERTPMMHRHEFLGEQLEVFEHVYEMCGQRSSDFKLARTGHMLEWAIILLLVAQLLLSAFESITSLAPSNTVPAVTVPAVTVPAMTVPALALPSADSTRTQAN